MAKLIQNYLLSFLLVFISADLYSNELWVNSQPDSRHYLTLDQEEVIKVKHYHQTKGDYQDLLSTKNFSSKNEAQSYIQNYYPEYKKIKSLPSWPVSTAFSDKRNSNLWPARNQWSESWEWEYAQWLKREIQDDFFMRTNIATDCADALIGYRWIFARIHSLPVANIVSDTGALFGHFSMRRQWENLPTATNWYDDQLFLTALNYAMDMTSTRTIMANDGFHVAITKKGLQSGAFIVSQTNGTGHIRTITQNFFDEPAELPLYTYSSTAPREVRALYREAFIDQAWPQRGTREIMAFRWPIVSGNSWILMRKESDPRYSNEQFSTALQAKFPSFIQFVLSRVKENYNPFTLVATGIDDLTNYTNIRIKIVRDGFSYCQNHNCAPGTQAYEDWSTPNRDYKYLLKFSEIEDLVKAFDPMYPGLYEHWNSSLASTFLDIEGYNLSLEKLRSLFLKKLTSYDPRDSVLKRWGLN